MSLEITLQQGLSTEDKIVAYLIHLRETFRLTNRDIASKLGLNENYLSRVFNRDAKGSLQLLKAVQLLEYQLGEIVFIWPDEATRITMQMIDLQRGQFNLPGRITKNGQPRSVPIIAEMTPLLEKIIEDYKKTGRSGTVLPCRDPSKSLETCCKLAGAIRITNHDLRHLFITRCIESGVDVKTVATWVGHQDGGALILKTYAHLRNEHSREMAAKVRFA